MPKLEIETKIEGSINCKLYSCFGIKLCLVQGEDDKETVHLFDSSFLISIFVR